MRCFSTYTYKLNIKYQVARLASKRILEYIKFRDNLDMFYPAQERIGFSCQFNLFYISITIAFHDSVFFSKSFRYF